MEPVIDSQAMSKYNSIYVWDNVDNIIHIVESLIDFKSKTSDLYNIKYCPKESEDCSHQYENCIRKGANTNKQFGGSYVIKTNGYSINESI